MLRLSLDGPDCISTRFWPRTTSSGRLATRRVAGGVDHQPVVVDRHAHRRHPLEPRRCGARGAAPAGAIRVVVLPVFALNLSVSSSWCFATALYVRAGVFRPSDLH